jgi:hypothetical protein
LVSAVGINADAWTTGAFTVPTPVTVQIDTGQAISDKIQITFTQPGCFRVRAGGILITNGPFTVAVTGIWNTVFVCIYLICPEITYVTGIRGTILVSIKPVILSRALVISITDGISIVISTFTTKARQGLALIH